jgi:chromosomal replication initiation ATPase DnaA
MTVEKTDCSSDKFQSKRAKRRKSRRPPPQMYRPILEHAVAHAFLVPGGELWSDTRGRPRVALARQGAMYLAHVVCGFNLTEVGSIFERDRTTVAHACWVIEDLREDPTFDHSMSLLESVLRLLSKVPVATSAERG